MNLFFCRKILIKYVLRSMEIGLIFVNIPLFIK